MGGALLKLGSLALGAAPPFPAEALPAALKPGCAGVSAKSSPLGTGEAPVLGDVPVAVGGGDGFTSSSSSLLLLLLLLLLSPLDLPLDFLGFIPFSFSN